MIRFQDVNLCLGTNSILNNINLEVPPATTHLIVGISGAGKSSMMKLMLGQLTPTSGTVELFGTDPRLVSRLNWIKLVGYAPQEGGLFPHLTGEANMALVATSLKWGKDRIRLRIAELAPLLELQSEWMTRYPHELSGGQRQRIAVGRALFMDPRILLFDEPLGALDPILRSDLQTELKQLFARLKKTVVIVTHDLAEAAYLSDTISLLQAGRIAQTGTFEDLRRRPANVFVQQFLKAQRSVSE